MLTWTTLVSIFILLFIKAIPLRLNELRVPGGETDRAVHQLYPGETPLLEQIGLSSDFYAFYNVSAEIIQALVFVVVGMLIFWRKPNDRISWFVSLLLVTMGTSYPQTTKSLPGHLPELVLSLGAVFLLIFPFLFPNGRFVPRWSRWLALLLAGAAIYIASIGENLFTWPTPLHILRTMACLAPGIIAQIYRYREISTPLERQQTKWVLYALIVAFLGLAVNGMVRIFQHYSGNPIAFHLAFNLLFCIPIVETLLPILIPISIAFSIFRFRLWDIDLVINRSLVYGLVTASLLLCFSLVAWGVQVALASLLGVEQPWAPLLMSAVMTTALAPPLYHRTQHLVDRQLYGFRFRLDELNQPGAQPEIQNPGALSGSTLGDYQLLGLLGKGGMGEVYQGRSADQRQLAAIKVLPCSLESDSIFCQRMQREAQALSTLNHPNIVHLHTFGKDQGRLYLAMEFIDGNNLHTILRKKGPFSLDTLQPVLTNLASALDHIHQHGIVHRDLKLSNIILRSADNQPVLMDFGIARIQEDHTLLTASGVIGTIDYMAPEQIMQSHTVDQHADLYALGILVFELLTGERPYRGNAGQILFGHLQQPPPDITHLAPHLPKHLTAVFQRALAKTPAERFQSANEFVKAIYPPEAAIDRPS